MKHVLFVLLILCYSLVLVGQEKMEAKKAEVKASIKTDMEQTVLHGYVVDAMCAKGMSKNSEKVMEKAASHSKSCAMHEGCASSGFGVFSEGKWYKFDEVGDKQAMELIKNSKADKGMMVEVSGVQKEGKFVVASITEHDMKHMKNQIKSGDLKD
ncbi:MAG: hypothetical protein ACKVRP_09950 [Bacteroidota bacterium]